MVAKLIEFFVNRHLLTNMVFISVIFGGLFAWQQIKKEERPDATYDMVLVSASYHVAKAEEIENLVTREL